MPVEICRAQKQFEKKTVFQDLSLRFPETGVVCLFGPSGCGKTTLLRCIAGLETLDGGSILGVQGKKISCVFQEDRLLPWATVAENIALVIKEVGRQESRRLAFNWLKLVGLKGEEDLYPQQLSSGMSRRVAIARCLAFGGDIFLLDEPFIRLDSNTRNVMEDLVLRKTKNALCILVSHDFAVAERLADVIFRFEGPPLTLISVDRPEYKVPNEKPEKDTPDKT